MALQSNCQGYSKATKIKGNGTPPSLASLLLPGLYAGSMDGSPRRGLLKADSFDVFYANNFAVGSWCFDEERERKEDNSEDCSKLDCKMLD